MWLVIAFFRYGFRALKEVEDGFYRSLIIGLLSAELSLLVHFRRQQPAQWRCDCYPILADLRVTPDGCKHRKA